jgi:hypothetical protein
MENTCVANMKTGDRKHGLQHLSMRSIFVLQSLLAFSTHQHVTFPYKEETKILRMYRCCNRTSGFPS